MALRILVLYTLPPGRARKTIGDHLYSFRRYTTGVEYLYFNTIRGIPRFLCQIPYDGVILHYTFLAMRWNRKTFPGFLDSVQNLRDIPSPKVAIPHDEYAHTADLWRMIREFGVKTVFTLADRRAYDLLYPPLKTGSLSRFTVFPGYVDELTVQAVNTSLRYQQTRPIDIGYRARKLPYWLGRYAQKKAEIGEVVRTYCEEHTGLSLDISTKREDVFEENKWINFLLRCKAVIGCEGGSQLLDADGLIRGCVETHVAAHPQATFDEVASVCFSGKDGKLSYLTISPRHFDSCVTKTCQILLEGHYAGILKPNVHYIELKKDYSNLAEVIAKVQDDEYRSQIVERAYRDIVISGKYTYRVFAIRVVRELRRLAVPRKGIPASLAEPSSVSLRLSKARILIHQTATFITMFFWAFVERIVLHYLFPTASFLKRQFRHLIHDS